MASDESKSYAGSHHIRPLFRGVKGVGINYAPSRNVEHFPNGEIVPEYMSPDDPRQSWVREHRVLPPSFTSKTTPNIGASQMADRSATIERLENRLQHIRTHAKEEGMRAMRVGEFVGAVAAVSYWRASLNKEGKPVPKIMGFDADTALGGVMVGLAFFDVIPEAYVDHAMAVGAGMMAGGVASAAAGWANPKIASKGDHVAGAFGAHDTSAHEGGRVIDMIRNAQRGRLSLAGSVTPDRKRSAQRTNPGRQNARFYSKRK